MDWLYTFCLFLLTCILVGCVMVLMGDSDILLQLAEKFGKSPKTLNNKVVWITGSSSGIGEYIAYELAKSGCKLILSARRPESELERVKNKCIKHYSMKSEDILVIPLEMTAFDTHQAAVEQAMKTFKKIDVLINNAGRSQRAEWVKTSLEVDRQILDVNVLGVLSLTKQVLPHMITRKEGHIVNTSSIAGKIGTAFSGSYAGSKHAIQGWFDSLRIEVFEHNISVTNLCPGAVFSNLLDIAFTEEPGKDLKLKMNSTDKRMSTQRCAELSVIAIANKLDEVWIALNPVLFFTYLYQYCPLISRIVGKRIGVSAMKKIREGR